MLWHDKNDQIYVLLKEIKHQRDYFLKRATVISSPDSYTRQSYCSSPYQINPFCWIPRENIVQISQPFLCLPSRPLITSIKVRLIGKRSPTELILLCPDCCELKRLNPREEGIINILLLKNLRRHHKISCINSNNFQFLLINLCDFLRYFQIFQSFF